VSTTVLPEAVVAPCVVEVDSAARTLVVWPAEFRSQAGRLWSEGLEELAEAEATGDWDWAPQVWAYAGPRRVARGVVEPGGGLHFRFAAGDPVYRELTGSRVLRAAVVVDRARARIMYVRFRGPK
jgi:hypothetical protein